MLSNWRTSREHAHTSTVELDEEAVAAVLAHVVAMITPEEN